MLVAVVADANRFRRIVSSPRGKASSGSATKLDGDTLPEGWGFDSPAPASFFIFAWGDKNLSHYIIVGGYPRVSRIFLHKISLDSFYQIPIIRL